MHSIGLDSCPGGWMSASAENGQLRSVTRVTELPDSKAEWIWIDIPIGLPARHRYPRVVEKEARGLLGPRKSSVFSVPCVEVLACDSYEEANRLHREWTGHGIARQSWNILPKISEAAQWAEKTGAVESHPELVFAGMNGAPMVHSKKTMEGKAERLAVLKMYDPEAGAVLAAARSQYLKKEAADDDLLDAAALAIAASHPRLHPERIGNPAEGVMWYSVPTDGAL
ncbi:DUF429 domain-containing protein [Alkalicoccus urumqiensis]|uniref:DUF429 domain-containing protein n=1 Tax=Alkalicoccus urumqiensis TaxID=1548213 RepID=A0A2P6MK58_ALKUR|nr:DUF429 domain-containing protein [Alkalicoccus urumqiensis]PRO66643.1 hypothetical protein C6I21_04690 [Alkalicoccus urumqiensis]